MSFCLSNVILSVQCHVFVQCHFINSGQCHFISPMSFCLGLMSFYLSNVILYVQCHFISPMSFYIIWSISNVIWSYIQCQFIDIQCHFKCLVWCLSSVIWSVQGHVECHFFFPLQGQTLDSIRDGQVVGHDLPVRLRIAGSSGELPATQRRRQAALTPLTPWDRAMDISVIIDLEWIEHACRMRDACSQFTFRPSLHAGFYLNGVRGH